jgi:hypothetical protein
MSVAILRLLLIYYRPVWLLSMKFLCSRRGSQGESHSLLGRLRNGITKNGISGQQLLFVGDLLQLPPVVQNMGIPVSRKMITRIPCWDQIHKFILREQHRSENLWWSNLLTQVTTGSIDHIKPWSQVGDQFHVHVAQSSDDALAFLCEDLRPQDWFLLVAFGSPHKSTGWGD